MIALLLHNSLHSRLQADAVVLHGRSQVWESGTGLRLGRGGDPSSGAGGRPSHHALLPQFVLGGPAVHPGPAIVLAVPALLVWGDGLVSEGHGCCHPRQPGASGADPVDSRYLPAGVVVDVHH